MLVGINWHIGLVDVPCPLVLCLFYSCVSSFLSIIFILIFLFLCSYPFLYVVCVPFQTFVLGHGRITYLFQRRAKCIHNNDLKTIKLLYLLCSYQSAYFIYFPIITINITFHEKLNYKLEWRLHMHMLRTLRVYNVFTVTHMLTFLCASEELKPKINIPCRRPCIISLIVWIDTNGQHTYPEPFMAVYSYIFVWKDHHTS